MKRTLIAPALLAIAGPAVAHEFWLSPSSYRVEPGETISVGASTGEGFRGPRQIRSRSREARFVARTRTLIDLAPAAGEADSVWIRFSPVDRGGAMLAYESGFTSIEIPAERFDRYLEEDGLFAPLEARRRAAERTPGRERYRRCAKTWLAGGSERRATTPIGLPLEIVPLALPGSSPELTVRMLWNGAPLAGVQISAWRAPIRGSAEPWPSAVRPEAPIAWRGRTDLEGVAVVPVAEPGEWLLGAVHMVPCTEDPASDWESSWASLTFARTAE